MSKKGQNRTKNLNNLSTEERDDHTLLRKNMDAVLELSTVPLSVDVLKSKDAEKQKAREALVQFETSHGLRA